MINGRLRTLRGYMQKNLLDAIIIPSSDPHQSEYVAEYWATREWISGFTGSAGLIVVTQENAGLWTDSRYFLQAEEQLAGTDIELHKVIKRSVPSQLYWLRDNLPENAIVGIDGYVFSKAAYDKIVKILGEKNISVKLINDFISEVRTDRKPLPKNQVFSHNINYAGISVSEKLASVRELMKEAKADYHLIATLDDIAWTLNLRGSDVELNPVFISYLIIGIETCTLFIDDTKLDSNIKSLLEDDAIHTQSYNSVLKYLQELDSSQRIIIDNSTTNVALYQSIVNASILHRTLITKELKAQKNEVELSNFRQCMVRDGLALTHAFMWLEAELNSRTVSEYEFASKIASCRSDQDHYHDESFYAIVGYQENGAIIHYRPKAETSAAIQQEGLLLVDSGGQYLDGTTDITRTIGLGEVEGSIKEGYTAVLKGMIALSMARFPAGTTGAQLDILARQHLWSQGKNFLHGTGHGVGFFLNVHEGPQGIVAGKTQQAQTAFLPGMVTSNEPGYYVDGEYGIRIENLIVCIPSEHEDYLEFETITYFPIDTKLIVSSMMTKQEIIWLNAYHEMVYDKLSPHLDDNAKLWLEEKCKVL